MSGALGRWLYLSYGFSVKFMAKNGFADKNRFALVEDMFMFPHQTKEDRYANYQLMLEMLRSGNYFDTSLEKLKKTNIPVRIAWGMKDKFFDNSYLDRWKMEIPFATIDELQNSGHFPQLEEPEKLSKFIAHKKIT
jgi:haloalkane dehalogenase